MKLSIKDLAYMSSYLALFGMLDIFANMIGIFKMPYGGVLGLAAVPLLLGSYQLGTKKAVVVSLAAVFLMFITGSMFIVHPIQFVLDYILAFSIYGIASLFSSYQGVIISNTIRFLCHFISGLVFFGSYAGEKSVVIYSLTYNAGFMIPTLLLCMIVVPLLNKRLSVNQEHKLQ